MEIFPFGYHRIHEASWAYLSSLLMLALFFKFNRFWSFRNLDLVLLILLAPGILMVNFRGQGPASGQSNPPAARSTTTPSPEVAVGTATPQVPSESVAREAPGDGSGGTLSEAVPQGGPASGEVSGVPGGSGGDSRAGAAEPGGIVSYGELNGVQRVHLTGYIWLFSVGGLFLLRMMLDPLLVRRPLLEPNLSIGGLVFLGCSLLTFTFADIVTSRPDPGSLEGARGAMKLVHREAAGEDDRRELMDHGPGYALLHVIPVIPTFSAASPDDGGDPREAAIEESLQLEIAAKTLAIVGQIAMVFGLIAIGSYHFSNFRTGVGIAVIWLMLPYTILFSGNAYHVLPAALIVWAVALYRQPMVAGWMLGLATGVSYYPLFLLPLWLSFYWESRVSRFLIGFLMALLVCVGGLVFTSEDAGHFFRQLQGMFGFWLPRTDAALLQGIWTLSWDPIFRLPLLVAFLVLCISFVFWPAEKNLAILMAYTSAVMIGVQFWHGNQGGTFAAWYLPLMLATIFRPNLGDRLAATQIPSSRRKLRLDPAQRVTPAA